MVYGQIDSAGSGAWCYTNALRQCGFDVATFNHLTELSCYTRFVWRVIRKVNGGVLGWHRERHQQNLRSAARSFNPDVIIILKGLHISRECVAELRQGGAWVILINHDDFFSRNPNTWSMTQRQALPVYDYIFTTREVNVKELVPFNRHVGFLMFAYEPLIHRPVSIGAEEREKWDADVVFVGGWERERASFIEALMSEVPGTYAIHGDRWKKVGRLSPIRNAVRSSGVFVDDMAKAIGGAKIALGFLRKENRDEYTQRTFEIPACGGVLVAERTGRHRSLYRESVEAEFFDPGHPSELCTVVRKLLNNPEHREMMRCSGRAALLRQNHTYQDRIVQIMDVYKARMTLNRGGSGEGKR